MRLVSTGYVTLSIATLLSQNHKVYAVDTMPSRIELINQRKSPIQDEYIEKYLVETEPNQTVMLDEELEYSAENFVVITSERKKSKTGFAGTIFLLK